MSYDILVVGAGPAGLVTAITAVRNGASVLLVEQHPGTSLFPRATGVSTRTMEIFRSWGVEDDIRAGDIAVGPVMSVSPTLREAMPVGLPVGYPTDARAVLAHSPAMPTCCPQDHIEPVLRDHLRQLGGEIRFGVELTGLEQQAEGVHATLRDLVGGGSTRVAARFVVGADGPRSAVRQALGIGLTPLGELGEYVNVIFRADLDRIIGDRRYGLYIIEHPEAGGVLLPVGDGRWCYARQWFPERGESPADLTPDRCRELIRSAVGDPALDVQLLARLPFTMAAALADTFRAGHGFLVGDAAHRMTPVGGVGMNTAIAAGHNLGWKLAWVAGGRAGAALLDSYEQERRPIGEHNARRSLRMGEPPAADPLAGDLGVRYASGVIGASARTDPALVGTRAPHAWFSVHGRRRSTIDLFDGRLTLLTGRRGDPWRAAAARLGPSSPLQVLTVGRELGGDRSPLPDDAAVLVRPDGYVGWRAEYAQRAGQQLRTGLDLVLGRGAAGAQLAA